MAGDRGTISVWAAGAVGGDVYRWPFTSAKSRIGMAADVRVKTATAIYRRASTLFHDGRGLVHARIAGRKSTALQVFPSRVMSSPPKSRAATEESIPALRDCRLQQPAVSARGKNTGDRSGALGMNGRGVANFGYHRDVLWGAAS